MLIASTLALLLASLAVAQTDSNANSCARSYEVQSGDTCDGISAANNVSTYQLYTLNTDINDTCSNLFVGQTLCLGLSEGDCQATYVVASGDYCWLIATNHGIDTETLLSNNPQVKSDCSNIYPGEVLCVSSEKLVTSPADPGSSTTTTSTTSTTSTSASETSTTSSTTTASPSDTASARGSASITTTSVRASGTPGKYNEGKKGTENHHGGHKEEGKHKDDKKDDDDYAEDGQCRSVREHRRRHQRHTY